MIELDSKIIVDEKIVQRAKENNCEPIYLALMPTLMSGQVQSREENFEIGHTLEEGFDLVALYQETAHGPYPARSVKCIDEISVESEKLRVNPFQDLIDKFFIFFQKKIIILVANLMSFALECVCADETLSDQLRHRYL